MPEPVPATGSYKLDGQLVTCPQITVFEYPNRSGLGADELQVQLITPPTAQSAGDNMLLTFLKTTGSSVADYSFRSVTHIRFQNGGATPLTRSYDDSRRFTLSVAANGAYSGTFSSTSPAFGTIAASQVTEGTFTNARPKP